MKQALREIESMTEGLESTGFDRRQSSAVIQSIASSIDKFALTPERMREALERNNDLLMERIEKRMDERFDLQNQLFDERFKSQDRVNDERFTHQDRVNDERFKHQNRVNDERFKHQNKRLDSIEASIKTGLGRLFALTVALTSVVLGVLARSIWF